MEAEELNDWSVPQAIFCQSVVMARSSSLHTMKMSLGPRSWVWDIDFRQNFTPIPTENTVSTVD